MTEQTNLSTNQNRMKNYVNVTSCYLKKLKMLQVSLLLNKMNASSLQLIIKEFCRKRAVIKILARFFSAFFLNPAKQLRSKFHAFFPDDFI